MDDVSVDDVSVGDIYVDDAYVDDLFVVVRRERSTIAHILYCLRTHTNWMFGVNEGFHFVVVAVADTACHA